jgi:hypothetical protein
VNLLKDFLAPSSVMPTNTTHIDICLLFEPYWDFSWLFSCLVGQDTTSYILRYVLYVLHFSVRMKVVFDWDEIISNEISYHLSNYMKTKRFFMTSYLLFYLGYCNVFEGLPPKGNVDIDNDLDKFWYPVLWRYKVPFHLCQVQDKFVKEIRHILIGTQPIRLTKAALNFLKGKGIYIYEEESTYIKLYGFKESLSCFPILFVIDIL